MQTVNVLMAFILGAQLVITAYGVPYRSNRSKRSGAGDLILAHLSLKGDDKENGDSEPLKFWKEDKRSDENEDFVETRGKILRDQSNPQLQSLIRLIQLDMKLSDSLKRLDGDSQPISSTSKELLTDVVEKLIQLKLADFASHNV